MPRTIESIVDSHRLVTNLRREGKPIWTYRVKIKDLFTDDESDSHAIKVANEVGKRLRRALPDRLLDIASEDYDDDICSLIEELEGFNAEGFNGNACDTFNNLMDAVYDWADYNRLWIG